MMLISLTVTLFNLFKTKALECVSVINQKCMARPKIIQTNANESVFYPLSIKVNKCVGDCNTINDPMAKFCVPDVVKDMNIKVFNMLSRINETRKIVWHETCKCICRLTSAICNDKQEWNENKCSCECKEDLVSKLVCDKGYMWNPSTCTCECDKYCEVGQYLDYQNCVCRKTLIDDLIEQCTSILDIEIKNGTYIFTSSTVTKNNVTPVNSDNSTNIYLFLFFAVLIVAVLVAAGFIYYFKKKYMTKLDNKIYDVAYLKSLEIKNTSYYYYDDIVQADEFDKNLIKVNKRESRIGADIYYIGYIVNKPQYNINNVNPLYLIVKDVTCTVEKIEGSSDRYLVIDLSNKDVLNVFDNMFNFISNKINKIDGDDKKVYGYIRLRFNSDVDLPLDKLIKFHTLTVIVEFVICKGNKFYPEIYVDEGIYEL